MKITNEITGTRYRVLIDRYEDNERVDSASTGKLIHLIHDICKSYTGEFVIESLEGGYVYKNGELKSRRKLAITFVDADKDTVDSLAADLCAFFKRSSVLVEASPVARYNVEETI